MRYDSCMSIKHADITERILMPMNWHFKIGFCAPYNETRSSEENVLYYTKCNWNTFDQSSTDHNIG